MRRKINNWHAISDPLGRPAWLAVFECGHLWQLEGAQPAQLPTAGECGVCAAEAEGAAKPSTVPASTA